MESSNSESPHIKWPGNTPETHLLSPFPPIQATSHDTHSHHDQKEIENELTNDAKPLVNDENTDTNIPFHLSHHHLSSNTQNIEIAQMPDISPQPSSNSSLNSSQNNLFTHGSGATHNLAYHFPAQYRHTHNRSNSDKLQRKLQKLEQDILSKNIQHDIMVNKEEMMAKRLKTKDIRIKNLQRDINKLRDQLTARNESQEKLMNEMGEMQTQNRGLSVKLRESNANANASDLNATNVSSKYSESMRDILVSISTDMIRAKDVQSIVHSCLKDRERDSSVRLDAMHESIRENKRRLAALDSNYFQTFFDKSNKLQSESQRRVVSELQQNIKSELSQMNLSAISAVHNTETESEAKESHKSNISALCKSNENMIKCVEEQISVQNNKFKQISDHNTAKTTNAILALKPLFNKLYEYFQKTDNNIIQSMQQSNGEIMESFAQLKNECKEVMANVQSTHSEDSNEYEIILREIQNMNALNKTQNKSSQNRSELNVISKNMQQINKRHNEIVKIITNTLPSSEMYNNLSNAIQSMNNWHKYYENNPKSAMQSSTNNHSKVSPQKMVYSGMGSDDCVAMMKSMIISSIEEQKKSFSLLDNNLKSKFDKLLHEMNSQNVSLFNNIKQLSAAKQQTIVSQTQMNNKKIIKTHESILKNHLQQIQLRLAELNKTQISIHKSMSHTSDTSEVQQLLSMHCKQINTKMEALLTNLSEMCTTNEIRKVCKDTQMYVRNDLMKEIHLIKNLSNDIHKKSQQLPHLVARNKDLKKLEQICLELDSNNKPLSANTSNNDIKPLLMTPLSVWCENILTHIANDRHNCSIYVIVYVLTQIGFNTFVFEGSESENEDIKSNERESENGLAQIQSRALALLNEIKESVTDKSEFDKDAMIENVMEWMQSIGNNNEEEINRFWIRKSGEEMGYFCNKELEMNESLTGIKQKMNEIISKQSNTCWSMTVFQPMLLCCPIVIALFCLWLDSIQNQQNTYF